MYNKTLWSPGDIITTSKWNNLTEITSFPLKVHQISFSALPDNQAELDISPDDLIDLLQEGYFCYFYNNLDNRLKLFFIDTAYEREVLPEKSIDPERFWCHINPAGWGFLQVDNNKIIIYNSDSIIG